MNVERSFEKLTFIDSILHENKRLKKCSPFQDRKFSYIDRGFYNYQIKNFFEKFDKDQMLFLKYEDYQMDNEVALNKIFDFLGVNPDLFNFEKAIKRKSSNSNIPKDVRIKLVSLYKYDILQLEQTLNWDLSDGLK